MVKPELNLDIRCSRIETYFAWVNQRVQWLRKVPKGLLEHLKKHDASFVFYDKTLTDLKELKDLKGLEVDKDPEGMKRTYDDLAGLYKISDKKVFLTPETSKWMVLHELGHCVDYLCGEHVISSYPKVQELASDHGEI